MIYLQCKFMLILLKIFYDFLKSRTPGHTNKTMFPVSFLSNIGSGGGQDPSSNPSSSQFVLEILTNF